MSKIVYIKTALTGGGASALDGISGTILADGDMAFVNTGGGTNGIEYIYILDADSAAAESLPYIVSPDNNAGDKRWILQRISKEALYDTDGCVFYNGSITLNGQNGVTVTHNKGNTNYIVKVMPKDMKLGMIGEISVVKAANSCVVYNTGIGSIAADVELSNI